MKTKLCFLPLILTLTTTLVSCQNQVIIKSPNEDMGLEGNASNDKVEDNSIEELKSLLNSAANVTKYSYEITARILDESTHFTNYYTPYAWYEENDDPSKSFGYAMTKDDHYLFKYYLSEDKETIYPSIYEYDTYDLNNIKKVTELYSTFTLTHISLLKGVMNDFSANKIGTNKYVLTSSSVGSVFQYLSTFGTSIINSLTGINIEIINKSTLEFKTIIYLGDLGEITSVFKPLETTPIDKVNNLAKEGSLVGVESHQDLTTFFGKVKNNNYKLEGIKLHQSTGQSISHPYTIYCTNDYFYLTYNKGYENYSSYGFMLVPKNQQVAITTLDPSGNVLSSTNHKVDYDACYEFKMVDEKVYFTKFIGPIESNGIDYLEVDKLPTTGNPNTLYICKDENGVKQTYEWTKLEDGNYGFSLYSTWPNSVGDIFIDGVSASFYLSSSPLANMGPTFFEKDISHDNRYFSKDSLIISFLSNGLFGWGFQATTTWMDYVTSSNITLQKDGDNIIGADVGLDITASVDGGNTYSTQTAYYTLSEFGNANVEEIDNFMQRGFIN